MLWKADIVHFMYLGLKKTLLTKLDNIGVSQTTVVSDTGRLKFEILLFGFHNWVNNWCLSNTIQNNCNC